MSESHEKSVWVGSMVSASTGEPRVELSFGENTLQLSIEEAREIGINILERCEAAQSDAYLMKFFERLGGGRFTHDQLGAMLMDFRRLRGEAKAGS